METTTLSNQSNTLQYPTKIVSPNQSSKTTAIKNLDYPETNHSTPNIEISFFTALIGIVTFLVSIGIAWGKIKTLIEGIQKSIDAKIEPELKDVRERFGAVENKVDTLWKNTFSNANSPRQLNTRGNDILIGSGIKEFIDGHRDALLSLIKKKDAKNAYDADMNIVLIMTGLLNFFPEMEEDIKTGAFKTGTDIESVLFVGSIYLRNLIFKDLGFDLDELDKSEKIEKRPAS